MPPARSTRCDSDSGGWADAFVRRLNPSKTGRGQLVYSTFLGGSRTDGANALSVHASGVLTVAGGTESANFPTTSAAYDTTYNGPTAVHYEGDAFVGRLDPRKTRSAQLVYSSFLGGRGNDQALEVSVDASLVLTVAGYTESANFPATSRAYSTSHNGGRDSFVSRLDMGVALWADTHDLSVKQGGTQKLNLNAGKAHANRSYWILGSITGTSPGLTLGGVHIPLNPDLYTGFTLGNANSAILRSFRGTLDRDRRAAASFHLPPGLTNLLGLTLHHAYVVYDASGKLHMASNAVPIALTN